MRNSFGCLSIKVKQYAKIALCIHILRVEGRGSLQLGDGQVGALLGQIAPRLQDVFPKLLLRAVRALRKTRRYPEQ